MVILLFLLISIIGHCYAVEYIYPIGIVPHSADTKVLCMHQDMHRHMHVYLWDSALSTYERVLSGQYNPIEVQLLPNGSGFSFIDNGIVKIKYFNKRSAKVIELYEPLYNIAQMTWVSDTQFVFQAKRGNRYGIYYSDIEGNVLALQADAHKDYGYPTVVDDLLFCICQDKSTIFSLMMVPLFAESTSQCHIVYESKYPLAYPTMFSPRDGYFVEVMNEGLKIWFFKKNERVWQMGMVGDLSGEGVKFFDNNNSLCEMFRPFLPRPLKNGLLLPIAECNVFGELSYYDIEKHCAGMLVFSSFFLPPEIKDSSCISFFGTPLVVRERLFIGLVIKY